MNHTATTNDPLATRHLDAAVPRLAARGVTLAYDRRTVIEGLDLEIAAGTVTAIIGPNGCGKSTLLRGLGRLLPPSAGAVLLDGKPLSALPTRTIAQRLSTLPQSPVAPAGLTVLELVARGRHPHQRWFERFSGDDERVVREALEATGTADLADASIDELSGGQRQRVWISMTLAQQSDTVLLDEPTTFLDVAHQLEVLELVRRLHRDHGRTIVMVLHDISHAARFAGRIVAMRDGKIVANGTPDEVVTPETLEAVFGIRAAIVPDPESGAPHVLPLGLPDDGRGRDDTGA